MTERMLELGFKETDVKELEMNPFREIGDRWMLITAGNEQSSNTMTASWGGMGVIWSVPVVCAVIRPQRHTKKFVDENELFTLSFYSETERKALAFCGSRSGSEFEPNQKAVQAGLTALYLDDTVAYEQAELILVCKKLYEADIKPEGFADKKLDEENYPQKDYHRAYIAQIVKAYKK